MDTDTIDTTTTHSGTNPSPRRPSWRRPALLAAVGLLAVVSACTHADRKELGEEDARVALQHRVEQAVSDRDLSLDGDLHCTAGIDEQGSLTASCEGTTTAQQPVAGSLTGTADVDAETCAAQLSVTVDGEPVADDPQLDCFHPAG